MELAFIMSGVRDEGSRASGQKLRHPSSRDRKMAAYALIGPLDARQAPSEGLADTCLLAWQHRHSTIDTIGKRQPYLGFLAASISSLALVLPPATRD